MNISWHPSIEFVGVIENTQESKEVLNKKKKNILTTSSKRSASVSVDSSKRGKSLTKSKKQIQNVSIEGKIPKPKSCNSTTIILDSKLSKHPESFQFDKLYSNSNSIDNNLYEEVIRPLINSLIFEQTNAILITCATQRSTKLSFKDAISIDNGIFGKVFSEIFINIAEKNRISSSPISSGFTRLRMSIFDLAIEDDTVLDLLKQPIQSTNTFQQRQMQQMDNKEISVSRELFDVDEILELMQSISNDQQMRGKIDRRCTRVWKIYLENSETGALLSELCLVSLDQSDKIDQKLSDYYSNFFQDISEFNRSCSSTSKFLPFTKLGQSVLSNTTPKLSTVLFSSVFSDKNDHHPNLAVLKLSRRLQSIIKVSKVIPPISEIGQPNYSIQNISIIDDPVRAIKNALDAVDSALNYPPSDNSNQLPQWIKILTERIESILATISKKNQSIQPNQKMLLLDRVLNLKEDLHVLSRQQTRRSSNPQDSKDEIYEDNVSETQPEDLNQSANRQKDKKFEYFETPRFELDRRRLKSNDSFLQKSQKQNFIDDDQQNQSIKHSRHSSKRNSDVILSKNDEVNENEYLSPSQNVLNSYYYNENLSRGISPADMSLESSKPNSTRKRNSLKHSQQSDKKTSTKGKLRKNSVNASLEKPRKKSILLSKKQSNAGTPRSNASKKSRASSVSSLPRKKSSNKKKVPSLSESLLHKKESKTNLVKSNQNVTTKKIQNAIRKSKDLQIDIHEADNSIRQSRKTSFTKSPRFSSQFQAQVLPDAQNTRRTLSNQFCESADRSDSVVSASSVFTPRNNLLTSNQAAATTAAHTQPLFTTISTQVQEDDLREQTANLATVTHKQDTKQKDMKDLLKDQIKENLRKIRQAAKSSTSSSESDYEMISKIGGLKARIPLKKSEKLQQRAKQFDLTLDQEQNFFSEQQENPSVVQLLKGTKDIWKLLDEQRHMNIELEEEITMKDEQFQLIKDKHFKKKKATHILHADLRIKKAEVAKLEEINEELLNAATSRAERIKELELIFEQQANAIKASDRIIEEIRISRDNEVQELKENEIINTSKIEKLNEQLKKSFEIENRLREDVLAISHQSKVEFQQAREDFLQEISLKDLALKQNQVRNSVQNEGFDRQIADFTQQEALWKQQITSLTTSSRQQHKQSCNQEQIIKNLKREKEELLSTIEKLEIEIKGVQQEVEIQRVKNKLLLSSFNERIKDEVFIASTENQSKQLSQNLPNLKEVNTTTNGQNNQRKLSPSSSSQFLSPRTVVIPRSQQHPLHQHNSNLPTPKGLLQQYYSQDSSRMDLGVSERQYNEELAYSQDNKNQVPLQTEMTQRTPSMPSLGKVEKQTSHIGQNIDLSNLNQQQDRPSKKEIKIQKEKGSESSRLRGKQGQTSTATIKPLKLSNEDKIEKLKSVKSGELKSIKKK